MSGEDNEFVVEYPEFLDAPEDKEAKAEDKPTEEKVVEEELPEISEAEAKARDEGWVPEDEYTGANDWVDIGTFNKFGELMSRVKTQTKTNKANEKKLADMAEALKELGDHNKKIADIEYKRAVSTLKKEKAEAMDMADHTAVIEIDEQISELKEAKKLAAELPDKTEPAYEQKETQNYVPEIEAWFEVKENSWYANDTMMKGAADAAFDKYAADNFGTAPSSADWKRALSHVDAQIRARFPTHFDNPRRKESAVTESNGRVASKSKSKFTKSDLSEEQLKVATTFVANGAFDNVQQYVDELAMTGDLN